ncbi:MAG: xylB [Acidimicrobiales bacterium]|nr:xylB [Acidimicrobiales bacterium]
MTQVSETSGITAGIDIGTTSVKAVVADGDGNVLARARVPHPVVSPADGDFTHDLDQAWRADVLDALARVARGHPLDAIAVSAMVPSLGAVTAAGTAAGPGLLYGDRRGWRPDHEPSFPGDEGEVLAFLAWQVANVPEAAGYWPAQAVANHALCGNGAIDINTAMTAYPLFDLERWDEALAGGVGADTAKLARVLDGFAPAGRVPDGRPGAGALVTGGSVDAFAEQIVSGATAAGDVLVLCGTTLITWAVVEGWLSAPGLWAVPHHVPDHSLLGGPSNAGGLFLDMATRWLGPDALGGLDAVGPADLPVWLPYVRGERTPLHRRDLRAGLHDVSHRQGASHVLAAAYEATGFVVRHHLDLARGAGAQAKRIVATGGGTRSAPLMQALADCTGLPVDVAALPEGAALGAAFLARCAAGLEASPRDAARWARTDRTVEPRPEWVDAAAARYDRFRTLTAQALDPTT